MVAYHESGHAIVATVLPGLDPVHKISIVQRGFGALGYTMQLPLEDRYPMTRTELGHARGAAPRPRGRRAAPRAGRADRSASSGSDLRAAAAWCSRARRSRAARSRSCAPDRARDDRRHDRVPGLVIRDDPPLLRAHHALLFEPGDDPVDRFVEILHLDRGLVVARREQRRLVDQVGEIRAGEPGRPRPPAPSGRRSRRPSRSSSGCAGSPRAP